MTNYKQKRRAAGESLLQTIPTPKLRSLFGVDR